jgi:thiol-disulfide isomerase/thioredoxin
MRITHASKSILLGISILGVIAGGVYYVAFQKKETPPVKTQGIFREYAPGVFEQYKGTPVIANSWAIWCPFCVKELADFASVQRQLGDEVVVVAINRAESDTSIRDFLGEINISENDLLFMTDSGDVFYRKTLNGFSMPETLFIDREGNVHFHKRGPMDEAEILERLKELL